jgi:hypothetical protein
VILISGAFSHITYISDMGVGIIKDSHHCSEFSQNFSQRGILQTVMHLGDCNFPRGLLHAETSSVYVPMVLASATEDMQSCQSPLRGILTDCMSRRAYHSLTALTEACIRKSEKRESET